MPLAQLSDAPPPVWEGECLRWQGKHHSHGYAMLGMRYVHRMMWERFHGPIPDGLVIDHVHARGCRFRDCIRITHMEPVPQSVNASRSMRSVEQRARTHCPQGHEYTPANTIRRRGKRECRTCTYARNARNRERRKALNAPQSTEHPAPGVFPPPGPSQARTCQLRAAKDSEIRC